MINLKILFCIENILYFNFRRRMTVHDSLEHAWLKVWIDNEYILVCRF
jgi:hypothetical protein